MPNYCDVELCIRAVSRDDADDVVRRFLDRVTTPWFAGEERSFSFNTIVPVLEESFTRAWADATIVDSAGERVRFARKVMNADGSIGFEAGARVAPVKLDRFGEITLVESHDQKSGLSLEHQWGTRWDAQNPSVSTVHDGAVFISFETGWFPPIPVVKALQELLAPLGLRASMKSMDPNSHSGVYVEEDGTVTDFDVDDADRESDDS